MYRVLSAAGLLAGWNLKPSRKDQGFVQPLSAHDHGKTRHVLRVYDDPSLRQAPPDRQGVGQS